MTKIKSQEDKVLETFEEYPDTFEGSAHRERFLKVFSWVDKTFPNLKPRISWNQQMHTDHGTFIIGYSAASKHMSVNPEYYGMEKLKDKIAKAGYSQTKGVFRILFSQPIDYDLLKEMIEFNIADKANYTKFWR
ncbi:MAG: DUF1801 domain-containing protein [Micrococcaceae bacterium]